MSHFTNPAAGSYMRGTNEMKFKLKVTLKHTGHWFLFLLCPQCLAPADSKRTTDFTFWVFSTQQQNLTCCILAFNFSFSNVKLPWSISFSSPLKLFRVSANLRRKHAQNVRAPLRTPQLKVFLTHNNGVFFLLKRCDFTLSHFCICGPCELRKHEGATSCLSAACQQNNSCSTHELKGALAANPSASR